MTTRELESVAVADRFVQQLSTTAQETVLRALVKSRYISTPIDPTLTTYTAEDIFEIEQASLTNDGVVSEEEYLKACEAEDQD